MRSNRIATALLLALVAVLVLGGCSRGSSGKKAEGEPDADAAPASEACKLVTRAEVESALSVTIDGKGDANQVGPAANCDWKANGQFIRLALVQANSAGEASQTFDALGGRPGAQPVADVGERAVFLGTPDTKNAQLFILAGSRLLTLSYCCADQRQLVDVGRKALDRLD